MNVLSFQNVYKNFCNNKQSISVLEDINLDVRQGEIFSILGPSGSGKSTILNLISGLISPTKGEVKRVGTVGYMFQRDHLLSWQSIYKNVLLGLRIQKNINEENIQRVEKMLKDYGLWDFRNYYPKQLSGGMRQRVALIRTLATNPDILLLDEPFASLDYLTKLKVSEDVFKIIKKENKTTILVTHDISEAISMSDRVVVLSKRPATIKTRQDIDFGDLDPVGRRKASKFQEYFDKIWEGLKDE